MVFIENILLNFIYLIFPIMIYLLYQVYSKTLNKEKSELYLDIALVSSFYLLLQFGKEDYMLSLILNIPLLIAYLSKRKLSIIFLSVATIIHYNHSLNIYPIYLIIEYGAYYLIFNKKELNNLKNISFFVIIKSIIFLIEYKLLFEIYYIDILLFTTFFYIESVIIMNLFKKSEEIIKLYKTIEELQEEKKIRESLFKITHEIKNPISVCKGYLDMFDINNREHSKKYIPIIKSEIERVLILLKDFLSIKKLKLEPDIIDINYLLEEVIDNFKPLTKDRKIKINFDECDSEIYVLADYNRLKQVFVNIIQNSIEALDNINNGNIEVDVEEDKNEIVIKIKDNGCGITKENLKRMNEPFFTTKQNGTGLGVYLSTEIIKAHGGSIKYSSEGKGTITTVSIPNKKGY